MVEHIEMMRYALAVIAGFSIGNFFILALIWRTLLMILDCISEK